MRRELEQYIKQNQESLNSLEKRIIELNTFSFVFSFSTGILAILLAVL